MIGCCIGIYCSEHTENLLNILSEAETVKNNEQTGRLRECDWVMETHGAWLFFTRSKLRIFRFEYKRTKAYSYTAILWGQRKAECWNVGKEKHLGFWFSFLFFISEKVKECNCISICCSEHTENLLNILSEAEEVKNNEQTGRLREYDWSMDGPLSTVIFYPKRA